MSYSNKTHVILIKGEVRTAEVSLVREDSEYTGTYLVYYKRAQAEGKGRLYQYSVQDINILKNPIILDPRTHDVYYQEKLLDNVYVICHFTSENLDYWTVGFADSRRDLVAPNGVIVVSHRALSKRRSTNVISYLTQMSYLHGYDMRTNEDVVLLGEQYDHIRRGERAPLLEAYLKPVSFEVEKTPECDTPIFPFYSNASQFNAVEKALSNRISIIQGPPGTGKTETILNLIMNLILKGKSVMVVAGSNSATDNILEKLNEEQMGFLVARLGRKGNKEVFIETQEVDNLCPKAWAYPEFYESELLLRVRQLYADLKALYEQDRELHVAIEKGEQLKVAELRRQLAAASYYEKRGELKELSGVLARKLLSKRFGSVYCRNTYTLDDIGENSVNFESFLQDYPIVLSTAFSATRCVSRDSLFDYVVMDEASQIDVATGALVLSVARNAVIVGDVKQLPNVIKEDMKSVSQAIFKFFQIPDEYNFANHNFLQSVCEIFVEAPETLLKEHYRCHPKIVRFFNNEFYGGQLVAMTEDQGEKDVLVLRTTVPGYHAADFTNNREEEEIEDLIKDLDINCEGDNVGIIVPYNHQKGRIVNDEDIAEDIMVDTVHKYQGRQKNTIIISTVDNKYTSFVNNPNLFNVAVSRAKKQLILVTNGNENNSGIVQHLVDYIRNNGGRCELGEVKSLFDLIYPQYKQQYTEYVNDHPQISENEYMGQEAPTPAEIIAHAFIADVLRGYPSLTVRFRYPLHKLISDTSKLESVEEIRFVRNDDAHIDFMILERKTVKPVLAVEIDGASYHIEGSFQEGRDRLKDSILQRYEIPMKRFRTKESIEERIFLYELLNNLTRENA